MESKHSRLALTAVVVPLRDGIPCRDEVASPQEVFSLVVGVLRFPDGPLAASRVRFRDEVRLLDVRDFPAVARSHHVAGSLDAACFAVGAVLADAAQPPGAPGSRAEEQFPV